MAVSSKMSTILNIFNGDFVCLFFFASTHITYLLYLPFFYQHTKKLRRGGPSRPNLTGARFRGPLQPHRCLHHELLGGSDHARPGRFLGCHAVGGLRSRGGPDNWQATAVCKFCGCQNFEEGKGLAAKLLSHSLSLSLSHTHMHIFLHTIDTYI
jgi:hypothetical protein